MVNFELHDPLHVRVDTENWAYLNEVKEHLRHYKDGYKFMDKYKSGQWDGKIGLMDGMKRTVPYGILLELIKYHKKEWGDVPYTLSPEVKSLFVGIKPEYKKDLCFQPYDYQDDCISACLKTSKGIIRSATASGKSLMISYVIKALQEKSLTQNGIIVVPSIGLVTQFYNDMEEYGMNMNGIGRVGDDWKEWNNPLVISTWQSLNNVRHHMERMDTVIIDEVHGAKAQVLGELLQECPNARWRYGFTGTMPHDELDYLQTQQYLGPVLREYGAAKLAKMGYVAEAFIKMVHIHYKKAPKGTYNEIKDEVFHNPYRQGVIKDIIRNSDGNVLILVGKVTDEGDALKTVLMDDVEFRDYEIEFLSGRDSATDREKWRKYMDEKDKRIVLIATYGIFQQGINIKSLRHLILGSPFKSKIRVLQSIGRTLRLHADKTTGATVWDICDEAKHLTKHSDTRLKHYNIEEFDVTEYSINEGQRYEKTLFG